MASLLPGQVLQIFAKMSEWSRNDNKVPLHGVLLSLTVSPFPSSLSLNTVFLILFVIFIFFIWRALQSKVKRCSLNNSLAGLDTSVKQYNSTCLPCNSLQGRPLPHRTVIAHLQEKQNFLLANVTRLKPFHGEVSMGFTAGIEKGILSRLGYIFRSLAKS